MLEEQEQQLLVEYLELKKIKFSALPLSTYTKSWKVKNRNKRIGVRAGIPDMLCIVNNRLIFIEMKKEKGGVLSDYQKSWIDELNKCEGVMAVVCKGFNEAKKVIDKQLKVIHS